MRMLSVDRLAQRFPGLLYAQSYDLASDDRYIGIATDYRHELGLAYRYANDMMNPSMMNAPRIFTHSLLDCVAYASIKVERHLEHEAVSEYTRDKSIMTFSLIGAMFRDTFKADEILFLNVFDATDADAYEIQERVRMLLEEFELSYHDLRLTDFTDTVNKMAMIIEPHIKENGEVPKDDLRQSLWTPDTTTDTPTKLWTPGG